jgi:esterase/lipase superfamily enzyme
LIPILFSWPSQGRLDGYKKDEEAIKLSELNLQALLLDLANNLNNTQLYVVAHSMGNRASLGSMRAIAEVNPDALNKFTHVIAIAPDVDSNFFKLQLAPFIFKNKVSVTLYASSADEILKVSEKEHNAPRLGQSGGHLTVMDGLETIDASYVHTDLLGHSYYKKGPVIEDIIEILNGKIVPKLRSNLIENDIGAQKYWVIK